MQTAVFVLLSNELIASRVYKMRLHGATDGIRAGQFVDIAVPGQFLRRPISVCDVEGDVLTLIYKVVGDGTRKMSQLQAGATLNVLTCLGNGYNLEKAGDKPLLVGGGVGVPPLYYLAKQLRAAGKTVRVILGFNTQEEVFFEDEFRRLGCEVQVTTVDGSYGAKGYVTAALPFEGGPEGSKRASFYYYACGPLPMLRALMRAAGTNGEVSMEERMGCGFGICVGCTIETKNGYKRVCKEGPVFEVEELNSLEV